MFKKKIFLLIFFFLTTFFFQKSTSKEIKNNIIVSVNNLIITELDLSKEINFIKSAKQAGAIKKPIRIEIIRS